MNKTEKQVQNLEKVRKVIHFATEYIQYIFALIIILGILVQLIDLPASLNELYASHGEGFHTFLEFIIDMIIGIELIHLLCQPNLDNVVEVLLIAITRELVLNEPGAVPTLLGVLSIGILFAIRKYLFIDQLDHHDVPVFVKEEKDKAAAEEDERESSER